MTIKDADPNDIDQMLPLLEQLFAIEADFNFDPVIQRRGLLLMLDSDKNKVIKVAVENGRIIGMCTAQTRISTAQGKISAVVEDLVVDKAFRGRGIGQSLLAAIEEWAGIMGMGSLHLLADKNNHKALDFYHALEWKHTALVCLDKSL